MSIKVGIVEDNQTLREGFETLLNRTPGFQCVCTCGTVAEALRQIPKARPDVVLMDIQLPDSTGVECTAKLKQQLSDLHIEMCIRDRDFLGQKDLQRDALYGKVKEIANSSLANFCFHLLCNAKRAKQSILPP